MSLRNHFPSVASAKFPCRRLLFAFGLSFHIAQSQPLAAQTTELGNAPSSAPMERAIEGSDTQLNERVDKLILELGSPSYAQRSRAKKELESLGLAAFDALYEAQMHPNTEISFSAKFLLGNLKVQWATESDAPRVRDLLSLYGEGDAEDRKTRLQFLGELPLKEAFAPLLRLARFESDQRLAREAALQILLHEEAVSSEYNRTTVELIRKTVGTSKHASADWMRALADEWESGRVDISQWQALIRAEQTRFTEATSRDTDPTIIFRLAQATADRAKARGDTEGAMKVARAAIDLVPDRVQNVLDAVQWANRSEFWDCVSQLASKHETLFKRHSELMYYHADSLQKLGQGQAAEELINHVLELFPIKDISDQDEITPLDETTLLAVDEHLRQGKLLKNNGHFDWSEREFRYVLKRVPVWMKKSVEVRTELVTLLQDQLRYADAVAVLEPLIERIQKDGAFKMSIARDRYILPPEELIKFLEYCRGMSVATSNPDQAREHYRRVFESTPGMTNEVLAYTIEIDVLIAMYQLPGDDAWREEVKTRLNGALEVLDQQIRSWERTERGNDTMSSHCNHYAWLVANTEGNLELALRRARIAVDHSRDSAAEMDTLARVLFKKGEVDQAIDMQRRALKQEPHSLTMQRQLQEFIKAKKSSSSS